VIKCSIVEAARQLRLSTWAVRKRIKAGVLAAEYDGRRWIVFLPVSLPTVAAEAGQAKDISVPPLPERLASSVFDTADPEPAAPAPSAQQLPDQIEQIRQRTPGEDSTNLLASTEKLGCGEEIIERERDALMARTTGFARQREEIPPETTDTVVIEPSAHSLQPIREQSGQEAQSDIVWPSVRAEDQRLREQLRLWRNLFARPFFSRLALVLVFCMLAIQAGLTVVLLGKDSASQIGAEVIVPVTTIAPAGPSASAVALRAPQMSATAPSSSASSTPPVVSRSVVSPAIATATPGMLPAKQPSIPPHSNLNPTADATSVPGAILELAAVEVRLQSGQFEATLNYGNGTRSSSRSSFDLGDGRREPRIHITTIYTNADTIQNVEQILIGERAWLRQADGGWVLMAEQEGMWGQLQSYMPHVLSASDSQITSDENGLVLRWFDRFADAYVTLEVNPTTGTPRRLQRVSRISGQALTVVYTSWNTPVEITAPPEQ
jgi:hypothetical protein